MSQQYQIMMSSVARVTFIKNKDNFRCHATGGSNQVSSDSNHETESYSCSNSTAKMGKNEKVENIFWVTKRTIKIGAGSRDYKLGKDGLHLGVALGISNRDKKFTDRGMDDKSIRNTNNSLKIFPG